MERRILPYLLLVGLVTALSTSGSAASPNIYPGSPTNGSTVSGTINLSAYVDDPDGDSITTRQYNIQNSSGSVDSGSYNTTYNASYLSDGKYNFTFYAEDNNTESSTAKVYGVSVDNGGDNSVSLSVDDGKTATQGSLGTAIAFVGSMLEINGNDTHIYNLTNSADQLIDSAFGSNSLNTSNASKGRFNVSSRNNTSQFTSVDLVSSESDVTGRIPVSKSSVDVDVLYWLNGSVATGSNNFSLSSETWPPSGSGETLYTMNFTRDRFWIRVNTSNITKVKPTQGVGNFAVEEVEEPRVNDFALEQPSNITGNATYRNGTPAAGIQLRLRRIDRTYTGSRIPYSSAPPKMHTTTDSTGGYKFTGLQKGENYFIDVTNHDHIVYNRSSLLDSRGVKINSSGTEIAYNFNVTPDVGNLSLNLQGVEKKDVRYGMLAMPANSTAGGKLEAGLEPGKHNVTLRNRSYRILAAKFVIDSNSSFPTILTESKKIKIVEDASKELKIGFPATVEINGTVSTGSGTLSGGQIVARNRSERAFYSTRVASDGSYSLSLENDTSYTFEIQPPFDSKYQSTETNVTITGDTRKNFSVSSGATLEGYVTSGGTGVGDVQVNVWNGTKNVYGENVTNGSGYYSIGGLESNLNYTVFVDPPAGYPYTETTAELSGSSDVKNISLTSQNYSLTVNVQDSSSNDLNATLTLESEENGVRKKAETTGTYSFTGLSGGFYRISADPENSSYGEKREFVYLDSDETVDMKLSLFKGLRGKVKDSSTGSGIGDAFVYAYNYSEDSFDSDETDSDGSYELELSQVDHSLKVYAPGDQNYKSNTTTVSASEVGGSKDIELSKGESLSGTIEDSSGNGLSGFISVYNSTEESYGYTEFSNGDYNVTGLKNVPYRAYVSVDSQKFSSRTFEIGTSNLTNGRNFTFGSNTGPELRVVVRDTSGAAVSNASVVARGELKITGTDGDVNFGKQPNNEKVTIRVSKPDYNTSSRTVTVKSTQSTSLGTTQVSVQNESFTIKNVQGELKDYSINLTKSGKNVSEASVVARSNSSSSSLTSSAITGSDGSGTLEDLLPGPYFVTVSEDGNLASTSLDLENSVNSSFSIGNYTLGVEGAQ